MWLEHIQVHSVGPYTLNSLVDFDLYLNSIFNLDIGNGSLPKLCEKNYLYFFIY